VRCEGNEKAGVGGAALQGGGALAGAAIGQALIPIPVVGAGIGAMVGNAIGGGLTGGAQALAEQSQKGTGGLIGGIGAALDPFIDTQFEREQKADPAAAQLASYASCQAARTWLVRNGLGPIKWKPC